MNSIQQPLISVLMPAYNAQDNIEESINSVLIEKDVPLEVIVVDDASTDNTPAIIDELSENDPRVRAFHRAENGGEGPTRNTGLTEVRGQWLILLDSDDVMVSGAISALASLLETTTADMVITHYAELDVRRNRRWRRYDKKLDEFIGKGPIDPRACGDDFFVRLHAVVCNKVFRMSHVRSLGMQFQDNPRNGDIYFTLGMPALSETVEFSGVELIEYRVNQSYSLLGAVDRFPLTDAYAVEATHDLMVERNVWESWETPYLNWAVRYLVSALVRTSTYDVYKLLAGRLHDVTLPRIGLEGVNLSELCTTGQYEICKLLQTEGPDPALHALMRLMESWRENNASDRDMARRQGFETKTALTKELTSQKKRCCDIQKELKSSRQRESDLDGQLQAANQRITELEADLSATWNSASMRIGRAVTFAPRHVRDVLARKEDR